MKKVKLRTDFLDYYDHHFDRSGEDFVRMSTNHVSRRDMFHLLRKKMRFIVPIHGTCSEMTKHFSEEDLVVVYTDEYAHCGEGKILVPFGYALHNHKNSLITEYLRGEVPSMSMRFLSIGARAFLLSYQSDDYWRSNCGDVKIKVMEELYYKESFCDLPLFAIDFVKDCGIFYAIDFNSAPGLRHTGIEDILKPAEVANLIKAKM